MRPGAVLAALACLALWARPRPRPQCRIVRIGRLVSDLDAAQAFYRDALGFQTIAVGPADPGDLALLGLGPARQAVMRLGREEIALVCLAGGSAPTPAGRRSDDAWFQHLAVVVRDIDEAYRHLSAVTGWTAISSGGPQTLPPANGGVRAFKFRDPDGHPLELIWFPHGQGRDVWRGPSAALFLGIDHSAIAVSAPWRSLRFYRALGFSSAARSRNHGPAQSRLDGLARASLSVVSLRPASADGPGLELLGYRPPGRAAMLPAACLATDWVCIEIDGAPTRRVLRDPDGHRVLVSRAGQTGAIEEDQP